MKFIFKFAAVMMAMALLAGPLMACMLPQEWMTDAEKECCKAMAGDCGSEQDMPSSHDCCQSAVRPDLALFASSTFVLVPHVSASTRSPELQPPVAQLHSWWLFYGQNASPPFAEPASPSILRI